MHLRSCYSHALRSSLAIRYQCAECENARLHGVLVSGSLLGRGSQFEVVADGSVTGMKGAAVQGNA